MALGGSGDGSAKVRDVGGGQAETKIEVEKELAVKSEDKKTTLLFAGRRKVLCCFANKLRLQNNI
ncbi:unnamed protein product [Amoebophrya sp. A25]|nr:unnamed protein product [Amoebophrya sp. A25]|eukprot:GSA25T00018753001.1